MIKKTVYENDDSAVKMYFLYKHDVSFNFLNKVAVFESQLRKHLKSNKDHNS